MSGKIIDFPHPVARQIGNEVNQMIQKATENTQLQISDLASALFGTNLYMAFYFSIPLIIDRTDIDDETKILLLSSMHAGFKEKIQSADKIGINNRGDR